FRARSPAFPAMQDSGGDALRNSQLWDLHACTGTTSGYARELQMIVCPIDGSEPLVHVAEPDSTSKGMLQPFLAHAKPVVMNLDERAAVTCHGLDGNPAATDLSRQAVLDGILDERLKEHARHHDIERRRTDLFDHAKLRAEPYDLDVEVFVDRLELLSKRHEM